MTRVPFYIIRVTVLLYPSKDFLLDQDVITCGFVIALGFSYVSSTVISNELGNLQVLLF